MAEIVQSLFGVTPELYQQAQQQRGDEMALQYAKLDPFQQANYAIGRGAYGLAGAVGGLLGGQDPELQRITRRQQIAQQINPNDPASIQQGIAALQQAGDTQGAMMLQGEYRKMQESMALVGQRKAAETASLAQAVRERAPPEKVQLAKAVAIQAGPEGSPEYNTAYAEALQQQMERPGAKEPTTNELTNARAIAAQAGPVGSPEYNAAFNAEYKRLTEAKAPAEAKPLIQKLQEYASKLPTNSPEFAQVQAAIKAEAEGKGTRVNVGVKLPEQEKEEKGARGKLLVEQYKDISNQAKVATRILPAIDANLDILGKGFETGFGTETKAAGAKVLAALGVSEAEKFATNAQVFQSKATEAVLQKQLEQKGPQTESDAKRIDQIGSQLGKTTEGNKFLLTTAKEQLKRDMEQRNFYDSWWKQNKTYDGAEDAWYSGEGGKSLFDRPALKKYLIPTATSTAIPTVTSAAIPTAAVPSSATPAPVYARNPQTNQRIMSTDGGKTWSPVRQ